MFLLREGVVIKHYIDDTLFFAYPNVCCRMEIYRARISRITLVRFLFGAQKVLADSNYL